MATYRASVRLTMEGWINVEADSEEAADEKIANMDYSQAQAELDLDFDEVDVLGVENLDETDDE